MSQPASRRTHRATFLWLAGALLLSLAAGLVCARAALGRTSSWSFPIDDAYIYANYVLAADAGRWFEYNPGERSGGVTGLGWLVLLRVAYPLTGPFEAPLSAWAPEAVRTTDPRLAGVAGRLYATAYGLGALLFAAAGAATGWLAYLVYSPLVRRPAREALVAPEGTHAAETGHPAGVGYGPGGRPLSILPTSAAGLCALLAGLLLLADRQAIWGAFSGLELAFSLLLVPLSLATLLRDWGRGRLAWSLAAAALLPWARPELLVFGAAGLVWMLLQASRGRARQRFRLAAAYGASLAIGLVGMALIFLGATGRPLPSSFYAKVGGPRPERALDAFREWQLAGQWEPFALLCAAGLGALLLLLAGFARRPFTDERGGAALLVTMSAGGFLATMMLTLAWFGQQDRYILPLHPPAIVLAVGVLPALAALLPVGPGLSRKVRCLAGCALLALLLLAHLVDLRVWAAGTYALLAQNIEEAHVAPAVWLRDNSAAGDVVAAEPIGAVRLFSQRPTVDIVGLTTPAALGTYGNWPRTEKLLRERGARFLLFYPAWWPAAGPPAWAAEVRRFAVADNQVAGDDVIAIYRLFER